MKVPKNIAGGHDGVAARPITAERSASSQAGCRRHGGNIIVARKAVRPLKKKTYYGHLGIRIFAGAAGGEV
mgnify:CR=1 FL=1